MTDIEAMAEIGGMMMDSLDKLAKLLMERSTERLFTLSWDGLQFVAVISDAEGNFARSDATMLPAIYSVVDDFLEKKAPSWKPRSHR